MWYNSHVNISRKIKMAKWKLDNGGIVNPKNIHPTGQQYHMNYVHRPLQYVGKESDFTILLDDGRTIKATFIKEPKYLGEYWQKNKVEGFKLFNNKCFYYLTYNGYDVIAYIPKSWSLERQIDALNKLIEIYKD